MDKGGARWRSLSHGLRVREHDALTTAPTHGGHPEYARLAVVLSECIAQNLLLPVPGIKCKGDEWVVLYLNRAACVTQKLPLRYGGWRHIPLQDLANVLQGTRPKLLAGEVNSG